MNGIILAAGLGKRLRPLTTYIPKPLLPIIHNPVLLHNIARLRAFGVSMIGINVFYQHEKVVEQLAHLKNLQIVKEAYLSGTGGPLNHFRRTMTKDFIVHNCDAVTNFDLQKIITLHLKRKPIATVVLARDREQRRVELDGEVVKAFHKKEKNDFYTYTGIAVLTRRIFSYLPNRRNFSIIEAYNRAIKNGETIIGIIARGKSYDIGTPHDYWEVHRDMLLHNVRIPGIRTGSALAIHPMSRVASKNLSGFVVVGQGCEISARVRLRNAIVMANSKFKKGNFTNCILSDKFCKPIFISNKKS